MAWQAEDGWVWVFTVLDQPTAEARVSVSKTRRPHYSFRAYLEGDIRAVRPGRPRCGKRDLTRSRLGAPEQIRTVPGRHRIAFHPGLAHLPWANPPCNGCAERFIRTLKE